jgi:hypothetical protein
MDLTPTRPHKNRKLWARRLRARKAIPDQINKFKAEAAELSKRAKGIGRERVGR